MSISFILERRRPSLVVRGKSDSQVDFNLPSNGHFKGEMCTRFRLIESTGAEVG